MYEEPRSRYFYSGREIIFLWALLVMFSLAWNVSMEREESSTLDQAAVCKLCKLPAEPFLAASANRVRKLAFGHAGLLLFGYLGIWYSTKRIDERISERDRARSALHETEEQLRQSQKMEALGQLAGGVAHDINSVLQAVGTYSYLIKRESAQNPALINFCKELDTSVNRGAALAKRLLAFSRQQPTNIKILDLNDAVSGMRELAGLLLPENIELKYSLCPDSLIMSADRNQVEQVVMNLVINARDAMPYGGWIRVSTEALDTTDEVIQSHGVMPAGRYAVLSVSDTGTGLDNADINRIFEPFYTTKEAGKGTGLGLSIVWGIVRQHNGFIDVSSEKDRGSTFSVFIPVAQ